MRIWYVSPFCVCAIFVSACVSLAPGAEKVRITKEPSDVSGCTAVGSVNALGGPQGPSEIADSSTELRNAALGLGGNVVFVTSSVLNVPNQGVAYRCTNPTQRGAKIFFERAAARRSTATLGIRGAPYMEKWLVWLFAVLPAPPLADFMSLVYFMASPHAAARARGPAPRPSRLRRSV